MSIESTRRVMVAYWEDLGAEMVADDATYTVMGTGEVAQGREEVRQLLHYFYQEAFQGDLENMNTVIADGQAVLEADFVGTHTGQYQDIAPTGKQVRVPMCVVYKLEGDKIARAHIYWEHEAFLKQIGLT
jgi:predicted ester cyclase